MKESIKFAKIVGVNSRGRSRLLYPEHVVMTSIRYQCANYGLCY